MRQCGAGTRCEKSFKAYACALFYSLGTCYGSEVSRPKVGHCSVVLYESIDGRLLDRKHE